MNDPQNDYTCKECDTETNGPHWATGLCDECRDDYEADEGDYLYDQMKDERLNNG